SCGLRRSLLLLPVVRMRGRHRLDDLAVDVDVGFLRVQPDDVPVARAAIDLVDHAVAGGGVHDVLSVPAVLDVGATADPDAVVAVVAVHDVVAPAATEHVVELPAADGVGAGAATNAVVSTFAVQRVVTPTAEDAVVALTGVDDIVTAAGEDAVVPCRSRQRLAVHRPLDDDDAMGNGGAHERQRGERDECEYPQPNLPLHSSTSLGDSALTIPARHEGAVHESKGFRTAL